MAEAADGDSLNKNVRAYELVGRIDELLKGFYLTGGLLSKQWRS